MSWNLEEFRTLCTNLGVPDTKIYQDALFLKSWRTSFFGGKALAAWENLHSTSTEIVVGGEEWNKIQFEAESFIEAALQASHSLADIIAQLINVTVLRNHFAEEDVSLNRVLQELVNRGTATQLTQTIQQFINSST